MFVRMVTGVPPYIRHVSARHSRTQDTRISIFLPSTLPLLWPQINLVWIFDLLLALSASLREGQESVHYTVSPCPSWRLLEIGRGCREVEGRAFWLEMSHLDTKQGWFPFLCVTVAVFKCPFSSIITDLSICYLCRCVHL